MNKNIIQFQMDTDRNLIAQDMPMERILEIRVQAPVSIDQHDRPQLNLALVLDRSGSMSGEKLNFVKQAARHVLNLLQDQDDVALVAYDDQINLLSPSSKATSNNRQEIIRRVGQLEPGGSTNLSGGWLAGCQEAASAAQDGTVNRTLLLTDGLANAGIVDLEELARHAKELSRRGISTSTFGVGEGFNEHLLEAMSNQGGGNFYYIDKPSSIPDFFLREFKELAAVTAWDVEVILDFPPDLHLQVPGGWRHEFVKGRLRIFLGNLFSGQTQEIYTKLMIPALSNADDLILKANVSGKGEKGQPFGELAEVIFQVAEQAKVANAPQNRAMLERFALVYLAEIANEALKLERHHENSKAGLLLTNCIAENREYLKQEDAERYLQMAERMKRGMDEMDRKQSHYNAYNQKRSREQ